MKSHRLMSGSPSTILGNINLHSHILTDSNWSLSSNAKAEFMVSDYYVGSMCCYKKINAENLCTFIKQPDRINNQKCNKRCAFIALTAMGFLHASNPVGTDHKKLAF